MGFFDWISDAAGSVFNTIKDTVGTVYNAGKSAVNWVADKVQPIVKTVGNIASYIPIIGAPISGIANQISSGIDVAKGFVGKAGDIGRGIGLLKQPPSQQFSRIRAM